MRLYYHPASTTSRILMLFVAENRINMDMQLVDILSGEHQREPFASINPNRLVPVLEDDGMRLTESSAILKFLADNIDSPAYPKDLKQRARVNERMDWFNSNLYRDYGYGLVYPQVFSYLAYPDPVVQKAVLERGLDKSKRWLEILDRNLLGPKQAYLCGEQLTIADHFGACMLEAGKLVACNFGAYPNVNRWVERMRALPSWGKVHEAFYGFVDSLKGKSFLAF